MGANGGLSWVKLNSSKNYHRFKELLNMFDMNWFDENVCSCSRDARDAHYKFLDNNPELQTMDYCLLVYGTEFRNSFTMDFNDVEKIVGFILENHNELKSKGINTFFDIALHLAATPYELRDQMLTTIYMNFNAISYENDKLNIEFGENFDVCLCDWAKEVNEIADGFKVTDSAETWT